ncbi:hypothetical protein E4U30_004356, partial [Claviceps sp. LM220 group G6]
MSELKLLRKELKKWRRRARVAKLEQEAAKEHARAAREKHERLYGPWTVKEYVEECHTLD